MNATGPNDARGSARGLAWLFGAMAFAQGVGEPTEGLIAQPVMSLLRGWGRSDSEITDFAALLALPWSLKPLFGLLTDFVPLLGSRRRNYLIASTAAAALGLAAACFLPTDRPAPLALLGWLLIPTAAVAFSDVVADALMIEVGAPRGLTGRLQAVQWACMYAATIATGLVGGWLSAHHLERYGFAICAALSAGTLVLTIFFVRDAPTLGARPSWSAARRGLGRLLRARGLLAVAGFLFLFNFNPFSDRVLYLHLTGAMGLDQRLYGQMVSILAAACLVASVLYGVYCRRVPMRRMVHASIALGVLMTLLYGGLAGPVSGRLIAVGVGLAYMTATLIQLDLAARACPPEVAGTAFAVLMALENLANASSTFLGGRLYAWGGAHWGPSTSFRVLVATGAAFTAASWLLVPYLPALDGPAEPGGQEPRAGTDPQGGVLPPRRSSPAWVTEPSPSEAGAAAPLRPMEES